MSVVAAKYVKKGTIMMSSDSFCRLSCLDVKRKDSKKLFRVRYSDRNKNKEFLFGSVGCFTDKWAFREFIKKEKGPGNVSSSITLSDRETLSKFMRDFRLYKEENHIRPKNKTSFIIACEAGLFFYDNDGELTEYKDKIAIGAGGNEAYSLMHCGLNPEKAVKICCETVCNVEAPVKTYELQINNL